MASSVVAALPSLASRLSIKSRLRVNASRFLKSSLFSTFLSSAALATIFISIRNDKTLSFLDAGSICARLGPSSSSASATSLWRISEPLTLASTEFASSARSGGPASRITARQPVTAAEARPKRRPVFVSGNQEVMENPYLQRWGCSGRRDTRPIISAWQREKSLKMMKSLTGWRVDKPLAQPYLCRTGSVAIARISLRFWLLNLGLPNSHSLGGYSPDRGRCRDASR